MRALFSWTHFDALLRGQLSSSERVRLPLTWLAWQVLASGAFGASLGVFALTAREDPDPRFMLASAVKVPLLLLFTSAVTIPSLYVFGALRGLRFQAREFAAHLMVAHTVLAAVVGSLAPVLAFFALTTSSHSFIVLLDVLICSIAGLFGIRAFGRALNEPPASLPVVRATEASVPAEHAPIVLAEGTSAARPSQPHVWNLLGWWLVLYVFVGTQAGWILRPFIGRPDLAFVLLRGKEGGFFSAVLHHLGRFLSGH
jgi:hypothetical protein